MIRLLIAATKMKVVASSTLGQWVDALLTNVRNTPDSELQTLLQLITAVADPSDAVKARTADAYTKPSLRNSRQEHLRRKQPQSYTSSLYLFLQCHHQLCSFDCGIPQTPSDDMLIPEKGNR